MHDDFDTRLKAMAEVIVRVGVNLQPGQPLLITDPYDLQGVHPGTAPLIDAIKAVVNSKITVISAQPEQLRTLIKEGEVAAYEHLVRGHIRRLQEHLDRGGAFVFLPGTHPHLLAGLPAELVANCEAIKWRHLGPLVQRLVRGATQWSVVPAPTQDWADQARPSLPSADRLGSLWQDVFSALRIGAAPAVPAWQAHLADLSRRCDELNRARHQRVRYLGPGTELTLDLPRLHVWCTAQLRTGKGLPFVANLPTEEIFTAPKKCSASGRIRVTRPVSLVGVLLQNIELEFHRGRVRNASAATHGDVLQRLLATDDGADRIGEVALVPGQAGLAWGQRFQHHTLLDENATSHVALGDSYRFCNRAWVPLAINASQIHLDLPLEANVSLS